MVTATVCTQLHFFRTPAHKIVVVNKNYHAKIRVTTNRPFPFWVSRNNEVSQSISVSSPYMALRWFLPCSGGLPLQDLTLGSLWALTAILRHRVICYSWHGNPWLDFCNSSHYSADGYSVVLEVTVLPFLLTFRRLRRCFCYDHQFFWSCCVWPSC